MKRRVIDISADELNALATEAWSSAAKNALADGFSVTGSRDGRRYRYDADGKTKDLGAVAAVRTTESAPESPRRATRAGKRSSRAAAKRR